MISRVGKNASWPLTDEGLASSPVACPNSSDTSLLGRGGNSNGERRNEPSDLRPPASNTANLLE